MSTRQLAESGRPLAANPVHRGRMALGAAPKSEARTRWLATVVLLIAGGMVPWTVFLAFTLPDRYQAGNWNVVWVGFDVALVTVLGYTAWAAWFRRQVMAATLLVAATLLLCDAWFDVLTSLGSPRGWISIVTALGGELPLAVSFLCLYHRIVLQTITELRRQAGDSNAPRRLRDVEVLVLHDQRIEPHAEVPFDPATRSPAAPSSTGASRMPTRE